MRLNYYINSQTDLNNKKLHPLTATTTDLGIWLNGKNGLVLGKIWQIRRMG
ncbi:hypothetical protein C8P67_1296 [Flavobacterium aquicola]|uniref:Uncharacterized protein n=1 Tax=Flavobacterium aquicola TaxID=1682742 RepID=A0A3E0DVY7_9FLAO|nr:hypothetical protein C8P67_1296 [Flavobacterium aquicola]